MGTANPDPGGPDPRRAGRDLRREYRLAPSPLAKGGQAEVFRAVHKPTETEVAFKRSASGGEDAVARMKREIEAARRFGDHPHVMPIIAWDPGHRWFIMPLADGTARDFADELTDPDRLRDLVTAVCEALRRPHREGWIHRDLKPDNILRFDGRWVVADWGLGRRPRGETSHPARTQAGTGFGTIGFAAPELSVDAHEAGPEADVYSIGQLIGWALTGRDPLANVALLPPAEPWRTLVRRATRMEAEARIADVDALLAELTEALDGTAEPVVERGRRLLAAGDAASARQLLELAAHADADPALFHQVVVEFSDFAAVSPGTLGEAVRAARSVRGRRGRLTGWVLAVARYAADAAEGDLLGDAAETLFALGGGRRADVREWVASLSGPAAATVAAARRAAGTGQPGAGRRPKWPVVAGAGAVAAGAAIVLVLNLTADGTTPPGADPAATANTARTPSPLAATTQLKNFVAAWDNYPDWTACALATGDEALNGSFPAAVSERHDPTHAITCGNSGNLTVMFAEHLVEGWYRDVADRYRRAPAPARPVDQEKNPPADAHVFQWSPTRRALVWTDDRSHAIGVLTTDSPTVDLVKVWSRYHA
ncbi:serine/threonine-protein kinase [Amycolatopsis eburnea]|uniref:non-specific serine/threonine protein kinase n=1 Tax=Amycolatopsis eburnea TaxID=2267691 RepID=A0A3R9DSI7_9PSEU|nr:serine/threonine-protein kinase [Amycolatopsis eburnea]RSD08626.1 serine/threonine protein kinase [Amycolatopsis eburnea]